MPNLITRVLKVKEPFLDVFRIRCNYSRKAQRCNVASFKDGGKWTPQAISQRNEFSPRAFTEERSSVDTLLLAQRDPYRTKAAEL